MTPERHQRIKRLFLAAIELAPSERNAFLASACDGDAELRREVETLLAHHQTETLFHPRAAEDTSRLLNSAFASTEKTLEPPSPLKPSMPVRPPGTVVAGRYRLVAPLGSGGMGFVYRAEDLELGHEVALKFLLPQVETAASIGEALKREVRIARQITHPNVVRVFDLCLAEGHAFVTMEYVSGEDLAALVRLVGPLPAAKVQQIARQLAAGLAAAHQVGILHRDLKPANVMLDAAGDVRMLDFGIAARLAEPGSLKQLSGTPGFLAPEVVSGEPASEKSDLFAWGLVVFYAAIGEPFQDRSGNDGAMAEDRLRQAGLSGELSTVVASCLSLQPSQRPASARDIASYLAADEPLTVAMRAGRMPSSAALAGAVSWHPTPRALDAILGGGLLLCLLVILLAGRTLFLPRCGLVKAPPALQEIAEQTLRRFSPATGISPVSTGVSLNSDCLEFVRSHSSLPEIWDNVAAGSLPAVVFWYRRGDPRLPRPGTLYDAEAVPSPMGSAAVWLDGRGNLLFLQNAAPHVGEANGSDTVDWPAVFKQAGLDKTKFKKIRDELGLPVFAEEVHHWRGPFPIDNAQTISVIGAAIRGRLVYFEVLYPWQTSGAGHAAQHRSTRIVRFSSARHVVWLLAIAIAAIMAWRNTRQAYADWHGAWRIAASVLALGGLQWLCGSRHNFLWQQEIAAAYDWLAWMVFASVVAALGYLAVEPYARRFWPWSILTLRRILDRQILDGMLWADVLLGLTVGLAAVLLRQIGTLANHLAGIPVSGLNDFDPTQNLLDHFGLRFRVSVIVSAFLLSAVQSLLLLVLVTAMRRATKSTVLSIVLVAVAVTGLSIVGRGLHSPIDWLARSLLFATAACVLLRFGLVATIVALASYYAVNNAPITLDWSAWYAPTGLVVILVVIAMLIGSWRLAKNACPLLSSG